MIHFGTIRVSMIFSNDRVTEVDFFTGMKGMKGISELLLIPFIPFGISLFASKHVVQRDHIIGIFISNTGPEFT